MRYNLIIKDNPYSFKNLKSTSEAVFIKSGLTVNLYESQNCRSCGYCATGYYKYIREPQHFKCYKCSYEWTIAVEHGANKKMDIIEEQLYKIDNNIEQLKELINDTTATHNPSPRWQRFRVRPINRS